jgi:Mce-associated membrane protein
MSAIPTEGSLRGRAQLVVVIALIVAVGAGALAVLGVVKYAHASSTSGSSGRTAALASGATTALTDGGQLAVDFTSFNYQTLDQDFTKTAKEATGAFAKTYLAQSRAVESLIVKAKAVSVSQVVATGLQSYTPSKGTATVLVALNVTTKNTKTPAGTVQYFRMQVQMVNKGGKWYANAVTPQ